MRAFLGSLGFLTTLPFGRDRESFEAFLRNLWIMPLTGAFAGFIIWLLSSFLKEFGLESLVFLSYLVVEGINHVDGLSDFFDSFFARDKIRALKDAKIGVGGLVAVSSYVIILYTYLPKADLIQLILAQSFAKASMLLLLLRNDAAWEGIASVFKENVRRRDYAGLIVPFLFLFVSLNWNHLLAIFVFLIVTFSIESYSKKHFGGISGDLLGAANCLTFALVIVCLQL